MLTGGYIAKAQKIDSLFFNLYTDSLKRGSWFYINVDAKLSNGKYIPLTAKELDYKISAGKLEGNSMWIEWGFEPDSVVIEAWPKKEPSMKKTITVWVKKIDTQLNAPPAADSAFNQLNNRKKPAKRKKKN
jgi:hypothetical protein